MKFSKSTKAVKKKKEATATKVAKKAEKGESWTGVGGQKEKSHQEENWNSG